MMEKKVVSTAKAPQAIGPYSQAILVDKLVFASGQIPLDPITGQIIACGIEEQTQQAILNLQQVLLAAGSSLDSVVKTTVFILNMSDFPKMNEVYSQFFNNAPPARSTVEVSRLPKDALVEIEAIAFLSQ